VLEQDGPFTIWKSILGTNSSDQHASGFEMTLFKWHDQYSVGIDEIDNHHKKLIQLINDLGQGLIQGKNGETVARVIDEVDDYARYHFSAEERLMEETGYPDLSVHREIHQNFVEQITLIRSEFSTEPRMVGVKLLNYLRSWIVSHIQGDDQKYIPHITKNMPAAD